MCFDVCFFNCVEVRNVLRLTLASVTELEKEISSGEKAENGELRVFFEVSHKVLNISDMFYASCSYR